MNNLLVIGDGFPEINSSKYKCSFIKDYVDLVRSEFDKVYVFAPNPILPKLLHKLPFFSKYARYSNYKDYSYDNVEVHYLNYFTLPHTFFRSITPYQLCRQITKIIKKKHLTFSVIHAHFLYTSGYVGALLKQKLKIKKLVITSHEGNIIDVISKRNPHIAKIEKAIVSSDNIISVSQHNAKVINTYFGQSAVQKNVVIHNFININNYQVCECKESLKQRYGFAGKVKILLHVGNIVLDKKGQQDVILIFDELKKRINNLKLVLIGDGVDKLKMISLIKKQEYSKDILYLGGMKKAAITDYYKIADVFVFPSRYESFGIVQLEALACGCPVIAYANGGSEYVLNGDKKLGVLLEKRGLQDLKKGIMYLLGTTIDRDYLHKYVKMNFSGEVIGGQLLNLYRKQ